MLWLVLHYVPAIASFVPAACLDLKPFVGPRRGIVLGTNTLLVSRYREFESCITPRIPRIMALETKEGQLELPGASNTSDSDLEAVAAGGVNEKRLLRTLDLRLLPAVSILYLLSFLDRSNGRYLFSRVSYEVLTFRQLPMRESRA